MDHPREGYSIYTFHDGREEYVHDQARPIVRAIDKAALEARQASDDGRWQTAYHNQETVSKNTKKAEESSRDHNSK